MITFLLPNLFMFKHISSESAILGYYFAIISLKHVFLNIKKKHKISLWNLLHISSVLITCIFYNDITLGISLVRFLCNFCLFCNCASLFQQGNEIKTVVKTYFAGAITAILMGILYRSFQGTLYDGFYGGINTGRNYFGAVISPLITIVIIYYVERKNSFWDVLLYGTTLGMGLIAILLSGSRTSVVCMLIPATLLLYYFAQIIVKNNRIKKMFPLAILLCAIMAVVYINYYDSLIMVLKRFGTDRVSTGNGRFTLWQYYTSQTFSSLWTFLIGCGSKYKSAYIDVEHNTVVQCFHQLGFLGLFSFTGIMKQSFRKITRGHRLCWVSFFPLLSVVVPYCGINGLYSDQLSFLLVLCAIIMYDFSERRNKKICPMDHQTKTVYEAK